MGSAWALDAQGAGYCPTTALRGLYPLESQNPSGKNRGRPPKPAEEVQTARLEIRMTDAEFKLIEKAAAGKTSTWARTVLVKAAKRR